MECFQLSLLYYIFPLNLEPRTLYWIFRYKKFSATVAFVVIVVTV